MIMLVKRDGNVEAYLQYEFISDDTLVLYGIKEKYNETPNYIVKTEHIQQKIKDGAYQPGMLPMIYDAAHHGPLTNQSFAEYGVPVEVVTYADMNSVTEFEEQVTELKNLLS